jgi:hypothetical protein
VPGIPVTIVSTAEGGASYSYASGGKTVAGSIAWVCST